jgi:SAM-dependent methyltransferase
MDCPACLKHAAHKPAGSWKEFSFYLCSDCGAVFCFPRKNPGRDWYEGSLIHQGLSNFLYTQVIWYHRQFLADPAVYGKTLLDVGCGTGNFLNLAREKYDVWGVDFNRASIDIARDRFGLKNVYASELDAFIDARAGEQFDVVTSFEVLEHQDSPLEFLGRIKKLLRPGGHLAISVPNRNSSLNTLGEADKPPNHLVWWDARSLGVFLERAGFEIVKLYPRPLDSDCLSDSVENGLRFSALGKALFKTSMGAGAVKPVQKLVFATDYVLRRLLKPAGFLLSRLPLQGSNLYALAKLK